MRRKMMRRAAFTWAWGKKKKQESRLIKKHCSATTKRLIYSEVSCPPPKISPLVRKERTNSYSDVCRLTVEVVASLLENHDQIISMYESAMTREPLRWRTQVKDRSYEGHWSSSPDRPGFKTRECSSPAWSSRWRGEPEVSQVLIHLHGTALITHDRGTSTLQLQVGTACMQQQL